jgi:hypothetical protein
MKHNTYIYLSGTLQQFDTYIQRVLIKLEQLAFPSPQTIIMSIYWALFLFFWTMTTKLLSLGFWPHSLLILPSKLARYPT